MDIKKQIATLPRSPGIYQFCDGKDRLLYVGKSVDIKKRVSSYFANKNLGPKTNLLVSQIRKIKHLKVFSEFEALLLESELIKQRQPFFNIQAKDDKSPIYIKIAPAEIPLVSLSRKENPQKAVFLKGPFQSTKIAKGILKTIRRIFPYCHHKNPKRPCLFVHLGLCPYPYGSNKVQQKYLKTIKKIKKLLSGNTKNLVKQLTSEMSSLAVKRRFEEANLLKKQIEKIQALTTTYHSPNEFLDQPTLVDDLSAQRLIHLKKLLNLPKIPRRIECFDISNISGQLATGAMSVFVNGQKAKDQYRRFKIKFTDTPNDYRMLKEVLTRRFKNNWANPDLIIIDGGKGQLTVALSVFKKNKLKIPIISLAKKLEQIYHPASPNPISVPKENPGRQLAQEARDEAHRFAITYHRLLRSKQLLHQRNN